MNYLLFAVKISIHLHSEVDPKMDAGCWMQIGVGSKVL